MAGKVYFIQRSDGLIKVGFSSSFSQRFAQLAKSHPGLALLKLIKGDGRREKMIHHQLRKHHEFGEWFRPEREVFDFIASVEDGDYHETLPTARKQQWAKFEEEHAADCQKRARALFQICYGWRAETAVEVYAHIEATYGITQKAFHRIYLGTTKLPSSAVMARISEAYIIEMTLLKEHLLSEIAHLQDTTPDPEELLFGDEILRIRREFDEIRSGFTEH